jgi:mRNA-degrading endonuclease RelE of RelBE toxin-antitoxin system
MARDGVSGVVGTGCAGRNNADGGDSAGWELRVQPYRVYYEVDAAAQQIRVVAIARKDRETARKVR